MNLSIKRGYPVETAGGMVSAIRRPGSRRWYFGALVGLVWLIIAAVDIYSLHPSVVDRVIATALILVFAVGFLVVPHRASGGRSGAGECVPWGRAARRA